MELSDTALTLIGLLLSAWTLGAAWMMIVAGTKAQRAETARKSAARLSRMVDDAPAVPMLVRADGRIEAPDRLAKWLGLETMPNYLSELSADDRGLAKGTLDRLSDHVRAAQKSAVSFRMVASPVGSQRSLALHGHLADEQISPGGAALVWFFDFSESEEELSRLRDETARAREDFAALVGLIEAAPLPMWFRAPDGRLRLVNSAYVHAVEGGSAENVIDQQIELVEPVDGRSAAEVAMSANADAIGRVVSSTISGQRRSLRVSDLPLGKEGIAGYAVDIEEVEEQIRAFRAFRRAQRAMLDQLSIGVAQFDGARNLIFANQSFRRVFTLPDGAVNEGLEFDRWLDGARDIGRLPETRDFPAWRDEHRAWFTRGNGADEAWALADGTHLRIVTQPMPDGGITLVAEDRTEQLALSATRDTLLRTRTATIDSLFESLAVFAPDGKLQLWNRSFASLWGLEAHILDSHPRADELLDVIGASLSDPAKVNLVGEAIRASTLDRRERGGRVELKDGRILEFAGVPLPDGNGLLTALDVTDSQRAAESLQARASSLEEADALKTRFLANMSYEFRTPLTSIGGFAELLEAGVAGELTEQGKDYVKAILASVESLSEQIETVLDLSQSEAGLLPLERRKLDLFGFVTGIVKEREDAIAKGGLSLDLRGTKSLGTIEADGKRLARALGHLLDNAVEATPEGGKILVDVGRIKGAARIVISDNGKGMTVRQLAQALEGNAAAPVTKRAGLGLPLAKQLVEAHGGTLELQSQEGLGTTATVILP